MPGDGGLLWKEYYASGVEHIDNQHKELFETATDNLLDLIQSPKSFRNKQGIVSSIQFLKNYTLRHFKDEQDYARLAGYPHLNAHILIHEALKADVGKYEKLLMDSNFALPMVKRFLAFVLSWLMQHVGEEDVSMLQYALAKNNEKQAEAQRQAAERLAEQQAAKQHAQQNELDGTTESN